MKLGDIVYVSWLDSASAKGWMSLDQVPDGPLNCETAGYLIKSEPAYVAVTSSRIVNDDCAHPIGDVIIIPRCAIQEIRKI